MFLRPLTPLVLCVLLAAEGAHAQPAQFTLDNSHSSMVFGIGHLGLSYTYGRFNKISGEFAWDQADPAKCSFHVVIDAASVDTNDPKRDEHLRTAEFLDTTQFPTIEFQSTSLEPTDSGWNLKGNLTMHGVTKEVQIPLTNVGEGASPIGDYRAGFLSQFAIKRSDYEMKGGAGMIGDDVTITFSFEGVRQP